MNYNELKAKEEEQIKKDEIFHIIESSIIEGIENGEIGCTMMNNPVILDRWKGKLIKNIMKVV